MRHIRQKLTLTPIRQLSCFPSSSVLLDVISQVEHHLIDLCLQALSSSSFSSPPFSLPVLAIDSEGAITSLF